MVAMGAFTAPAPGVVGLSEPGELLVDGRTGSVRHLALFWGGEIQAAWADMLHSARTGRPSTTSTASHTSTGSRAIPRMRGCLIARWPAAGQRASPRLLARDWSGVRSMVDVGGG